MKYVEVGEMEIKDKYYVDKLCKALEDSGFQTALIYDGIGTARIRILTEQE